MYPTAVNMVCTMFKIYQCYSSHTPIKSKVVKHLLIISIKNAKLKFRNYIRRKLEILRLLWDIIVFRLVAYLLNMICLILQLLYKIAYIMNFRIDLTQFDINFLYVSFNS